MTPSNSCYNVIKHYEGCKLEAYLCSAGKITIGFGNTFYPDGKPVKIGDKITLKQAEDMLPNIVLKFAQGVDRLVKRELLQCEFDALVSFAYNCGIGVNKPNEKKKGLAGSTLLVEVNRKSPASIIEKEFLKYNRAGGKVLEGLTRRRKTEALLYNQGILKFNF